MTANWTDEATLASTPSVVEEIAALTRTGVAPAVLDPGKVYIVHGSDGAVTKFDLTADEYTGQPRRKKGLTKVTDTKSFVAYWDKHSDEASEIYADLASRTITAVLDAHTATAPRWGGHILRLTLRLTPAWEAWTTASRKMLWQQAFAEFIEDHRPNIVQPAAADVLELAQSLQVSSTAEFRSGTILKSGQRELAFVETHQATAGKNGRLSIPDSLTLALQVFDGDGEAEAVTARLRYRITDGKLQLGVILDDVDDKVRAAFDAVVATIGTGAGSDVLRGTPAGA